MFNETKFKVKHIGKGNIHYSYNKLKDSKDIILQQSDVEGDLGVFLEKDLNFDHKVQRGIMKADITLGLILKNSNNLWNSTLVLVED